MKTLLAIATMILFCQASHAGDNPTCEELNSAERQDLIELAQKYFINKIVGSKKGKGKVNQNSLKVTEMDCHDYDDEFDHMEYTLSWLQVEIKQGGHSILKSCNVGLEVSYMDEVTVARKTACEEIATTGSNIAL